MPFLRVGSFDSHCERRFFLLESPAMIKPEVVETPPSQALAAARATKNPLRKLYFWTLHWAETKYAVPALFALSFTESSFFPIPPDVLLIALCFAQPRKWIYYGAVCTVASVLGGMLGWYLGLGFWHLADEFFFRVIPGFTPELFEVVRQKYNENAFLAILTAAFTPIPYKVFTIASGVFQVSLWTLVISSILGRGMRFFLVCGLIRGFGPRIKPFLEKHFEVATLLLLGVAVLGFVAIKYLH
jgi:membrane protein YqaA with SNARE-associated domain